VFLHQTSRRATPTLATVGTVAAREDSASRSICADGRAYPVTRRAKKAPDKGAGASYFTLVGRDDVLTQCRRTLLNRLVRQGETFGWPCDETLEKLPIAYSRNIRCRPAKLSPNMSICACWTIIRPTPRSPVHHHTPIASAPTSRPC